MGSRSSALTGISRLFSSDDGGVLKQVKLTGQQPGPLCPALLQGNLTEGGDDWTVLAPGQLLKPHYTRQGTEQCVPASDTSANMRINCTETPTVNSCANKHRQ